MLDFYKLIPQISLVGKDGSLELDKAALVLEQALQTFLGLTNQAEQVLERLSLNEGRPLWPVSLPLDSFASMFELSKSNTEFTVIGVDGSQIMPSQHEIVHCYLLNIGTVQINYGTQKNPILTSTPYLFHKHDQLYPLVDRRRLHIDELHVALERNLLELEMLSMQAESANSQHSNILSLIDGSLIPWSLERMPPTYQSQYILKMSKILNVFKRQRIPLFGYISNSRSAEVINNLRILTCPYEYSDCKTNCRELKEDDFPCSRVFPLTDSKLFSLLLTDSHRSATFLSGAKISKSFSKDLQICFLYCNFDGEVARLECPRWLFEDKNNYEQALAALALQVNRGVGYPVVLAEAHHQAVIKNADREQFFSLLAKHFLNLGSKQMRISAKASKKRFSAV